MVHRVVNQGLCHSWLLNCTSNFGDEFFEHVRSAYMNPAAPSAIRIQIRNRFPFEFSLMFFGPFGRAQEPEFFTIPERNFDGALGLPSLFLKNCQRARGFHEGNCSRDW